MAGIINVDICNLAMEARRKGSVDNDTISYKKYNLFCIHFCMLYVVSFI